MLVTNDIGIDSRLQKRKSLSPLRQLISSRLLTAKNNIAPLTTFNDVDMSEIITLHKKYKAGFKMKHGTELSLMSFFTKAVCEALKEWPSVNAQMHGNDMIHFDFVDISISVSSLKGFVVPVIVDAHKLSLSEIEKSIATLAVKAQRNELSINEMTGGTFTITNEGIYGAMVSTPILNAPQSAVLGMHKIIDRAVVVNGTVVIRPMMYIALSYDHRIIDGRESVSFLVKVKQLLEDPFRLLLEI